MFDTQIALSRSEAKILQAMLATKERIPEEPGTFGMTNAKMGKYVPRRTFDINKQNLLDKWLISEVFSSDHGKQVWKYYDITLFGYLSLLNVHEKNSRELNKIRLQEFFPLVAKYWDSIKHMYSESVLNRLLDDSLSHISLSPSSFKLSGSSKKSFGLKENLALGIIGTEVFLQRHHLIHNKKDILKNTDALKNIVNSITFLFYFSFFIQHVSIQRKNSTASIQLFTDASGRDNLSKEMRTVFASHLVKLDRITQIIKNDDGLNNIFEIYLNRILGNLEKPEVIKYLERRIL